MTQVRIRKVSAGDRVRLVSIIDRTSNLTEEERNCAVELLDIYLTNKDQSDYSFITAADGSDSPLGYICYGKTPLTDAVYDLYWILVDPGHRQRGVGRSLLEHTEGVLKKQGARLLVAETSGLKTYEPARGFYLRNGFNEEARIREFYKPGDDLVVYVKRIQKAL